MRAWAQGLILLCHFSIHISGCSSSFLRIENPDQLQLQSPNPEAWGEITRQSSNPPSMAPSREIYASFSVTSGRLCFGALHNIWDGASGPLQGFPAVLPRLSGTVRVHSLQYNVPAQNGTWNAFPLVDIEYRSVSAWFVCHSDVDPDQEIDKILRVSGSPYEVDSGSSMNNNKTHAEGVFVINRYDWGYYNRRFLGQIGEEVIGDDDPFVNSVSAGLVDYAEAKSHVQEWREHPPSERRASNAGIWMVDPHGEYMFGRFGFDDELAAARSFLFFSTDTTFTRTTFAGLEQPLRKFETNQERYERKLREGYNFSGIAKIREMSEPLEDPTMIRLFAERPPESEYLGPYDPRAHIFRAQDLEALRRSLTELSPADEERSRIEGRDIDGFRRDIVILPFVESWKDHTYDLLNEMVLSYLERSVLPHAASHSTPLAAAEVLFPNHAEGNREYNMDARLYPFFTQPYVNPIREFDADFVGGRIREFLASRSDAPVAFDEECIAGLCRAVASMIADIVDQANASACSLLAPGILPEELRWVAFSEAGALRVEQYYSSVFWNGRE